MSAVYDYIVANLPVALSSIFLLPLAFLVVYRVFVNIFKND